MLTHPVRDRIPIYVAALGDKNVRMTAEVADGWLPFLFIPEKAADVWGAALAAGAAKRSPDLGPLEVVAGGPLAIGDDVAGLRELARPQVGALHRRHGCARTQLLQRPRPPLRL